MSTCRRSPLAGIGAVAHELTLSIPTVTVALDLLVRLGIAKAKEVTGKRRARIFGYSHHLKILSEGTEPIQP
jgi:hypothetical protein